MSLFETGDFQLHAGNFSTYKIDCDFLSDSDIAAIAFMIKDRLPPFSVVEGVPRGGLRLADELMKYCRPYKEGAKLLIVDDVCTSGGSLETHRNGREAIGAVIFARGPWPEWVKPLFVLDGLSDDY